VTEDEYLVLRLAFESCLKQGYRRIGLAFLRNHNRERQERWTGAFLSAQQTLLAPEDRLPMYCRNGRSTRKEAAPWLEQYRPDIVLTDFPDEWTGGPIPFMAFASPAITPVAGVYENSFEIGHSAADLVVSMITRNERGLPVNRQTVLVEPVVQGVECTTAVDA
jgi:DNA-binding LacI/PurR family transcriptional regulator